MEVLRGGEKIQLVGNPPEVGEELPKFKVFTDDGEKIKTRDLLGKPLLISVVPDLNTPVCSIQTKKFNQQADKYPGVRFVTISNNMPQDQANWCAAEGVNNLEVLSDHELSFGYEMNLYIPNAGYLARSIFIVDADGKIVYREIVPELHDEPNYEAALSFIDKM
ncbi:thiol peroxidase [Pediococcus stilesii]|uniref:Thiol peroxidase n=1 Tax=Pediococcus stilesii TaxID=331679 RepID=A0A0R2KXP0_9LACO|nr:thiol peroxidase [Pediococcus stilesii]KRN94331.1 thiol peroxidase (atypical 2-Cys peroxiredoxin) [Pediococcus stilesii]TLQ05378.1 thiol peroxidase [Pediococcus stilesii]